MNNAAQMKELNEIHYRLYHYMEEMKNIIEKWTKIDEKGELNFLYDGLFLETKSEKIKTNVFHIQKKEKIIVTIKQLATCSNQEGLHFRQEDSFENSVGKIGHMSVKQDAEFTVSVTNIKEKYIQIKPIEDLAIQNKTNMMECLQIIQKEINEQAEKKKLPIQAFIVVNPLDPEEKMALKIETTTTGEKAQLNITDIKGEVAEKLGIKKSTNFHRYKKGTNCLYTLEGESFISESNTILIRNGAASITFLEKSYEPIEIEFKEDSRLLLSFLEQYSEKIKQIYEFVLKNKFYVRSDIVYFIRLQGEEKRENLSEENVEEMKAWLFEKKQGKINVMYPFVHRYLSMPFGMFAREEYNPFIQKIHAKLKLNTKL